MQRSKLVGLLAGLTLAIAAFAPSIAGAWAPAGSATIHPGVQTVTQGAQCTANFIYQDGSGTYIGQAAHCSAPAARPRRTAATAARFRSERRSRLMVPAIRARWSTTRGSRCRRSGERPDTCAYNDLALVRLDPADVANTNPSVPGFGGPTGLGSSSAMLGDTVFTYGNSSLRSA